VAVDIHLDVPQDDTTTVYTVEVSLNGQRALASSCQIHGA
jgi:hypothetical protein